MQSRFKIGDAVVLRTDYAALGLLAGALGVVWMQYDGEHPAYEVTFVDETGGEFDVTLTAEELTTAPVNRVLSKAAA